MAAFNKIKRKTTFPKAKRLKISFIDMASLRPILPEPIFPKTFFLAVLVPEELQPGAWAKPSGCQQGYPLRGTDGLMPDSGG